MSDEKADALKEGIAAGIKGDHDNPHKPTLGDHLIHVVTGGGSLPGTNVNDLDEIADAWEEGYNIGQSSRDK